MAENPGDLSLPLSVISRIITDALPANTNVSLETRKAIAKAASVFVLYATASAAGMAAKRNRKTTNANDVLDGIVEMDFTQFSGPLKKALEHYKQNLKKKPPKGGNTNGNSKKGDDESSDRNTASEGTAMELDDGDKDQDTASSNSTHSKPSKSATPSSMNSSPSSNPSGKKRNSHANSAAIELVTLTDSDSSSA